MVSTLKTFFRILFIIIDVSCFKQISKLVLTNVKQFGIIIPENKSVEVKMIATHNTLTTYEVKPRNA